MSKYSVSPSWKQTFTFVFLYSIIIAATVSFGRPWRVVFAPSFLCIWSQMPWQSQQIIMLPLGFLHIHLQEFVKVCDVMDLFLRKPFWLFLRIFSILGSMWLRSRALYILATMNVSDIPWLFLANPRSPFLGKVRMLSFVHLFIVFWLYMALQYQSSMLLNSLVFHTSGGISSSPAAFLFLIFLSAESSSSCVNCPSLMSNSLLIILMIGPFVTFGGFLSKFSKCCFHSCILFFLAVGSQFSFCSAFHSAYFIYRLPCYPRLSIFNKVSNLINLILYVFCLFFKAYVS